jgi:hypothetical protein
MDINLSVLTLRKGVPFILNGHIEDDRHAIQIDGLKRVKGASIIGEFHYVPVMFCEARRARKSERQLLAAFAVLLSRIQGARPAGGILYLGRGCDKEEEWRRRENGRDAIKTPKRAVGLFDQGHRCSLP